MTLPAKQATGLLMGLIAISTVSLGAVVLHPRRMQPPARQTFARPTQLMSGVRKAEPLPTEPTFMQRGNPQDIARGEGKQWSVVLEDGRELLLTEMPLRVKSFNNFQLKRMKQLFAINGDEGGRTKSQAEGVYLVGSDQVLVSQTPKGLRAETCITANNIGSVSQHQLIQAVRDIPLSRQERVESMLGLRQPREWQCLYVAVTLESATRDFTEATSAWRFLRQTTGP